MALAPQPPWDGAFIADETGGFWALVRQTHAQRDFLREAGRNPVEIVRQAADLVGLNRDCLRVATVGSVDTWYSECHPLIPAETPAAVPDDGPALIVTEEPAPELVGPPPPFSSDVDAQLAELFRQQAVLLERFGAFEARLSALESTSAPEQIAEPPQDGGLFDSFLGFLLSPINISGRLDESP